jgi:hypothetical protein
VSETPLPDKILAIHGALASAKLPHAFGGALALAYYAEPRTTIDIDLNLFVAPARYSEVAAALAPLGVGEGSERKDIRRDGQGRLWWSRTPLDLFFAYDALHQAMGEAVRKQPFGESRIPILAPEHLLICKAIFDRPKDWLDIEQMVVCVEELDRREVLAWLARIVGVEDPRYERSAALLAE